MSNNHNKKPVGRPKKRSMAGTAVSTNPGRPPKTCLRGASYSTKNRRAHEIVEMFDFETIQLALNIVKRNENYVDAEVAEQSDSPIVRHSLESAFSLFLENDFSKLQWQRLVKDSKEHGAPIYPSFDDLGKIKEQCRPSIYSVENEICVEVSFQVILNKTAERLVLAVGTDWTPEDLEDLVLTGAYGFDSSSGFNNPHQKFDKKENITLKSDQSLFASTFTIVALLTRSNKKMFVNPTPQSIRFCRPLRIALEKETEEAIKKEQSRLESEVEKLQPHCFSLPNGKKVSVDFNVYLSMVDGKCLNYVLDNDATVRCPVCFVTMDKFNTKADWDSKIPKSNLKHGIGNLHCEIKSFEQLVKLSCRLDLETWTVRGDDSKEIKDQAMERIKDNLFKAFSIRIDQVKQGPGTSVNGNTARKCFNDISTFAEALGVDEELVKRLAFVLLAFKQKEDLNMEQLDKYCTETYKLFFELYPWAKMNPTVHKMLRHGVDIAKEFPLSLAFFAEDAAESMHKYYKKNSISHARQNSRANRLKDVFNRAADFSDPLTSMVYLDDRVKAEKKELPTEFISLFKITNDDEV